MMTDEAWREHELKQNKSKLLREANEVAGRLRRLADEVDFTTARLVEAFDDPELRKHITILERALEIQHAVVWGVANMPLERLVVAASKVSNELDERES